MSKFLTPLDTRTLSAEECDAAGSKVGLFELLYDFVYESDVLGCSITVAAGFVTDYASIPHAVDWYIDSDDPCIAFGSVIHDWIYSHAGQMPDGRVFSRQQADALLRETVLLCKGRSDQAAAVYSMVRLFGGSHWKPSQP